MGHRRGIHLEGCTPQSTSQSWSPRHTLSVGTRDSQSHPTPFLTPDRLAETPNPSKLSGVKVRGPKMMWVMQSPVEGFQMMALW